MGIQPLDRRRRTPVGEGWRDGTVTARAVSPAGAVRARLRPGPHARERDHLQRLVHQRSRLCEAMVQQVAEHGYAGTTVQELTRLAGVPKRSLYEQFTGEEDCMVAGSTRELAQLAESLAFLVLAPTVGSERTLAPADHGLAGGR